MLTVSQEDIFTEIVEILALLEIQAKYKVTCEMGYLI